MASYTIAHSILIKRIKYIGIVGIPLVWIKSYLTERKYSIKMYNHYSYTYKIYFGVLQDVY